MFKESRNIYIEIFESSGKKKRNRFEFFNKTPETKKQTLEKIRKLKETIEEKEEEKEESNILEKLDESIKKCPKYRSENKMEITTQRDGKKFLGYKCLNCKHKWFYKEIK